MSRDLQGEVEFAVEVWDATKTIVPKMRDHVGPLWGARVTYKHGFGAGQVHTTGIGTAVRIDFANKRTASAWGKKVLKLLQGLEELIND